jgi:aspartate 1-decarboxylase
MQTWAFNALYKKSANGGVAPFGTLISSVTIAASTSAAAGVLPNTSTNSVQIANTTNGWAFVNFGVSGNVTAATVAAGYPVAPGAVVVVTVDDEVNGASVILAAGSTSGSVIFTCGSGL